MGLRFGVVAGAAPWVTRVWTACVETDVSFTSAVKGATMISFARYRDQTSVYLHGPETRATQLDVPEGWEFFGVELQPGAYLPAHPPLSITDLNDAVVPLLSTRSIGLAGREWELPTAQNVDVFVTRLIREGVLVLDPVVDALRHGERPADLSERTAQTRFRRAVGISRRKLVAIEHAHRAAQLLVSGGTIADAVVAGGYYDQPQLARAMRWATGHTPSELRTGARPLAF